MFAIIIEAIKVVICVAVFAAILSTTAKNIKRAQDESLMDLAKACVPYIKHPTAGAIIDWFAGLILFDLPALLFCVLFIFARNGYAAVQAHRAAAAKKNAAKIEGEVQASDILDAEFVVL